MALGASTEEVRWIMDSGSAADLISEGFVDIADVEKAESPLNLCTANGIVTSDKVCQIQMQSLHMNITANMLGDTPAVLSMGKRCMEDMCSFRWDAGKLPTFTTPDGKTITLQLHYNVPYVTEKQAACLAQSCAAGGAASSGSGTSRAAVRADERQDFRAAADLQLKGRRASPKP
jgi:hypothetical protein